MNEDAHEWPFIIDDLLLSMQIRKHKLTGISPFFIIHYFVKEKMSCVLI